MKYLDKRTNEIKTAYSVVATDKKVYIKFSENGREYAFNPDNVEVIEKSQDASEQGNFHRIYKFDRQCYTCKKSTAIYTYIIFSDGTDEDVVFPWNKKRLLKNQNIIAHLQDPSIEYYGLNVIGSDEKLDDLLQKKFPENIKVLYSKTQKRRYPMNVCEHCGAKQGEYFIYQRVNEMIMNMEEIEWVDDLIEL